MKPRSKVYFILAVIFGITFFVLLFLKIDFLRYGLLGASIGAGIRGF
jgi:hypothetical protein